MGVTLHRQVTSIAGRVDEQGLLFEAVRGAAEGRPCAVLVHGEAGVGKTRLVTEVCADVAEAQEYEVLWGQCVRFGATSSPYLPIISALRRWLATATSDERTELLGDVAGLDDLLPVLDEGVTNDGTVRLLSVIDTVLGEISKQHPVVLVVDDLQWADVSSLDVLAYLLTGFRGQRLAVLATYRDEELVDGHPLHGWLADMERLPATIDLPLGRITIEETEQQLELLLGSVPSRQLLDDVYEKSHGNCYLTELLVRGVPPDARRLPEGLPDALRTALLAAWHRLSEPTRETIRLLAIGGRPLTFADLRSVQGSIGVEQAATSAALTEAIRAGVVQPGSAGEFWFRHPLLAEVLTESLPPGEEQSLHSAFVEAFSAESGRGHALRADLALHCEGAGLVDEAFLQYLRAADEAGRVHGYPEQMRDLLHAAALWSKVSPDVRESFGSEAKLLADIAFVARSANDAEQSFAAIDRALAVVDRRSEPLVASRVFELWGEISIFAGAVTAPPLEAFRTAVDLAADQPSSVEHVRALAALGDGLAWAGQRQEAELVTEAAVQAARLCDDLPTRSLAHQARSLVHVNEPSGVEDAEEAHRLAVASGDRAYIALACIARANYFEEQGQIRAAAELFQESVKQGTGGRAGLEALHSAYAAYYLLMLGDFTGARSFLRESLSARSTGVAGLQPRLMAMQLALREGNPTEAAAHLVRAREMVPDFEEHTGMHGPSAAAEYLVATRRPSKALQLLLEQIRPHGTGEPRYADVLLTHAAHAAAVMAEVARDNGDEVGAREAVRLLGQVREARRSVPREPFARYDDNDLVQPAMSAFFDAEVARCHNERSQLPTLWLHAAEACAAAGLRWHEGVSWYRHGQALVGTHGERDQLAAAVRNAHAIARDIGAEPLRVRSEQLAHSARVSLDEPSVPVQMHADNGLSGLTRRELEVLGHLVAGRSNTEIGRALFISDKTVSVHVSNLLRKTGTANRMEAAAFARRQGIALAE